MIVTRNALYWFYGGRGLITVNKCFTFLVLATAQSKQVLQFTLAWYISL